MLPSYVILNQNIKHAWHLLSSFLIVLQYTFSIKCFFKHNLQSVSKKSFWNLAIGSFSWVFSLLLGCLNSIFLSLTQLVQITWSKLNFLSLAPFLIDRNSSSTQNKESCRNIIWPFSPASSSFNLNLQFKHVDFIVVKNLFFDSSKRNSFSSLEMLIWIALYRSNT